MTGNLATIEERLARLEAIEEIRRLKARYLRACDLKSVDVIRDCFLPGTIRIEYQGFPAFADRDAFVREFRDIACHGGVYDLHHATNADIEILSAERATGLWSLAFRTILLETRTITRLAVEYEDSYQFADGRWWIAETQSRIMSFLTEEIDDEGFSRYLAWGSVPQDPGAARVLTSSFS